MGILRTPRERLYWLITLYKNGEIEVSNFCNEFHITFDHEFRSENFTDQEYRAFRELAYLAARYSEFEEDHKNHPNVYTTDEQIEQSVVNVIQVLKM